MGKVETTIDFASRFITNETIPWQHAMHSGTVARMVVGSGGSVRIKTIGEGVNITPPIAFLNDKLGAAAWRSLDNAFVSAFRRMYSD